MLNEYVSDILVNYNNVSVPVPVPVPVSVPVPVAKRWRKLTPNEWKQNEAIKQRTLGKAYSGKRLIGGIWTTVGRPAREMGELCTKDTCKNSKKRHCEDFLVEDCEKIFKEYWGKGNKGMQDKFICLHVELQKRKLQRILKVLPDEISQGRSASRKMGCLEVCKDMFLNTLSISNMKLNTVLKAGNENVGIKQIEVKKCNPMPSKGFSWNQAGLTLLKDFFDRIPKAPGHYCRKDSKTIPWIKYKNNDKASRC